MMEFLYINMISIGILKKKLELPLDKIIVMHTGSLYKGNDALLFEKVFKI